MSICRGSVLLCLTNRCRYAGVVYFTICIIYYWGGGGQSAYMGHVSKPSIISNWPLLPAHLMSTWEAILHDTISLNRLCGTPLPLPAPHQVCWLLEPLGSQDRWAKAMCFINMTTILISPNAWRVGWAALLRYFYSSWSFIAFFFTPPIHVKTLFYCFTQMYIFLVA